MKLTIRPTSTFAEIKVDEIETTLHKIDTKQIQEFIQNLVEVADTLMDYTGETFKDYVNLR